MTATDAADAGYVLDRDAYTIRIERNIGAEPHQIFAAWTQPEHVTQWWDVTGKPLTRCEIDLRVGGTFTFVVEDHPDMPFTGVYRQIVPNELLEFDAVGALGRVSLTRQGDDTHLLVEIVCSTASQLEMFIARGIDKGTSTTVDNLVHHLE